jgi:hypothetical protein
MGASMLGSCLTGDTKLRIFEARISFPAQFFWGIYVFMTLSLQPNPDGSPGAYDVLSGALKVGHIYKRGTALRPETEWTWTLNGVPDGPEGLVLAGCAESREGAEVALRESWEQWLAWAGLSDASGGRTLSPPDCKLRFGSANGYSKI